MPLLLGDILRRHAEVVPDKVAYVLRSEDARIAVTYGELGRRADRMARGLAARGIGRGDRVAVLMRNHVDQPVVYFALLALGAVAVPLNFRLRPPELARIVARAGPKLLVVEPEPGSETEALARAVFADADGSILVTPSALEAEGRQAPPPSAVPLEETDPFAIFYTSGTTGEPKGVVQNHRAWFLQTGQPVFSARGTGEHDVGLCMFQLFHTSGWRTCLIYLRARATVVILRNAEPRGLLEAIEQERVTQFMGLPETMRKVCDLAERERFDLDSLVDLNTGTSTIDLDDVRRFVRGFGVAGLRVHYGSSECGPVSSLGEGECLDRPRSIGRPAPNVDVAIVDEQGTRLAPGEVGEIRVRSEFLMAGYEGAPEATAEVLSDGWYRTGDLGRADAEGYLEIVGRVKERIRSAGETVHPREVEDVIAGVEGVAECAVLGVPDLEWGEVVLAVIVPAAGAALDAEAIVARCRAVLAGYKVPRHVRFVDALPKTAATDKVRKAVLRERFVAGGL